MFPFEKYGLQFDHSISSNIYQGITNSKLTKKHLGVDYETLARSGADMNAIARSITLAEYGEKMLKDKVKNTATSVKKEILEKTQNAQIKNPGSVITPEDPEKKVQSTPDKVRQYFQSTSKGL
jgi:vancomycin resistance protein YoaR